jgi:hypothetical protein
VLDSAFSLSGEEQFFVAALIGKVLDQIGVPNDEPLDTIPAALSLEISCGFYTTQLTTRPDGRGRGPRPSGIGEVTASLDDWRDALVGMVCSAYPELDGVDRLILTRGVDDLLIALGLPDRGASHLPGDVVNAHREAR